MPDYTCGQCVRESAAEVIVGPYTWCPKTGTGVRTDTESTACPYSTTDPQEALNAVGYRYEHLRRALKARRAFEEDSKETETHG